MEACRRHTARSDLTEPNGHDWYFSVALHVPEETGRVVLGCLGIKGRLENGILLGAWVDHAIHDT